jgi:FixJ family two-component response regulator
MGGAESSDRLVYVVDDDPAVRQTLSLILAGVGYRVICFPDGQALLDATREETPFCILLDVFLDGTSGIEILKQLNAGQRHCAPVFLMSGRGTIPLATDSILNGACDFIEKPFKAMQLIETIEAGARQFRIAHISPGGNVPLTSRELQIVRLVADGLRNKEIALELAISSRTVEYHRLNLMNKMHVKNSVELVQKFLATHPRHRWNNKVA